MGWIAERCYRQGGSIGGRKGKHKGPLKKIVRVLIQSQNMFDPATVELECGHEGFSYGGLCSVRARCAKCGKTDPRFSFAKAGRVQP